MTVSAFVDYAQCGELLRPCVIVHRGRKAVAVSMDLGYLFAGGDREHDLTAMTKCLGYAAILFDGTFIKSDVLKIHELICEHMGQAFSTPPAPKELEFNAQKFAEDNGIKLNIDGEEVINAAI